MLPRILLLSVLVFTFQTAWAAPDYLKTIDASPMPLPPAHRPVVIAIVDDGVRLTHRDIAPFIWINPREIPGNGVDDDGNGYIDDIHGWDLGDDDPVATPPADRPGFYHGTYVAGIVTSVARSVLGESAPRAIRIMPVKVISDGEKSSYLLGAYAGIKYAIDAGADVILTAWGLGSIAPAQSAILKHAADRGVLVVASAGNFPEQRDQYPAAYSTVLAVAALNTAGSKLPRSNFGQFVDLSAPGEAIEAASHVSDDGYLVQGGTSPSAAMVAVAAALVKVAHPGYTTEEVKACLEASADPIPVTNQRLSGKLGAGLLDVDAAIRCDIMEHGVEGGAVVHQPRGFLRPPPHSTGPLTWEIKPQGTFRGFRFTMRIRQTPEAGGSLEFSPETGNATPAIVRKLSAMGTGVFVPGSSARVRFLPGPGSGKFDWLLEYEAQTIRFSQLYCRGTKRLMTEGAIEDGSKDKRYAANSDCKWLITAPPGKVIRINFTKFDTEPRRDLVYFFNGDGTQDKIMAIFSGNHIPPVLTTWRNQVLIWFVTDGQHEFDGWQMHYRFVDPPKK